MKFATEEDFFQTMYDDEDYFEYKNERLDNFDSEKGFVDVTVFLERYSDKRRFTATFTRGGQGDKWANELEFTEIPKKKPKAPKVPPTWKSFYKETGIIFNVLQRRHLETNYAPPVKIT